MATITSSNDSRTSETVGLACQCCGRETPRLYGEGLEGPELCALCHLQSLTAEENAACAELDLIRNTVRAAVVNGYAHPDDVREEIERALCDPHVAEFSDRKRVREVRAECKAHAEALRDALEAVA